MTKTIYERKQDELKQKTIDTLKLLNLDTCVDMSKINEIFGNTKFDEKHELNNTHFDSKAFKRFYTSFMSRVNRQKHEIYKNIKSNKCFNSTIYFTDVYKTKKGKIKKKRTLLKTVLPINNLKMFSWVCESKQLKKEYDIIEWNKHFLTYITMLTPINGELKKDWTLRELVKILNLSVSRVSSILKCLLKEGFLYITNTVGRVKKYAATIFNVEELKQKNIPFIYFNHEVVYAYAFYYGFAHLRHFNMQVYFLLLQKHQKNQFFKHLYGSDENLRKKINQLPDHQKEKLKKIFNSDDVFCVSNKAFKTKDRGMIARHKNAFLNFFLKTLDYVKEIVRLKIKNRWICFSLCIKVQQVIKNNVFYNYISIKGVNSNNNYIEIKNHHNDNNYRCGDEDQWID